MTYDTTPWTIVFCFLSIGYCVSSIPISSYSPSFPCTETPRGNIVSDLECVVNQGQFLNYSEIREVANSRTTGEKFNVSITCNGGKIFLPWPFRAANVFALSVRGCRIAGFYAERFVPQVYPDELVSVVLSDVTLEVSLTPLYELVVNMSSITAEFDCGPVNVEQTVFRNVNYDFILNQSNITDFMLMERLLSGEVVKDLVSKSHRCEYPYLQYMEESGMTSLSKLHFKLVQESKYPQLRAYSFRNNSLSRVPEELRDLRFSFLPNLIKLDLSFNTIKQLDFVLPSSRLIQNQNILHVDMRNNAIGQMPETLVAQLAKDNRVVIDLRSNPLVCSCSLYMYGLYLEQMATLDITINQYRDLTCYTFTNGLFTHHSLFDVEHGKSLCSLAP